MSYSHYPQLFPHAKNLVFSTAFTLNGKSSQHGNRNSPMGNPPLYTLHNKFRHAFFLSKKFITYHNCFYSIKKPACSSGQIFYVICFVRSPIHASPWWHKRSSPAVRCSRPDTRNTPVRRSSPRYHRTSAAAADTA